MSNTDLRLTNLRDADLSNADLSNAKLDWANLSSTNLKNACLSGTKFLKTKLRDVDLSGAKFLIYSGDPQPYFIACAFGASKQTDFRDIYLKIITPRLQDVIEEEQSTSIYANRDEKNAVRREPTEEEKEKLVGKENVDKCIWGDIFVLEENETQDNSE